MPWAGEVFIIAGLLALVLHGIWTEYRLFHLTGILEELLDLDEEES